MSRRRALMDLNLALDVRRVQEQAALLKLKVQHQAARTARDRLDASLAIHRDNEIAWADALEARSLDLEAMRLWRAQSGGSLIRVRADEASLETETSAVAKHRDVWERQLRLAEAVWSIAIAAARSVRRSDDERRLVAAEDARHARRPRG